MVTKQRLEAELQKMVVSPTFKNYQVSAKASDIARTKQNPTLRFRTPADDALHVYSVTLTADFKSVKVQENNGFYKHEVGFWDLSYLENLGKEPAKPVAEKPKTTTRRKRKTAE